MAGAAVVDVVLVEPEVVDVDPFFCDAGAALRAVALPQPASVTVIAIAVRRLMRDLTLMRPVRFPIAGESGILRRVRSSLNVHGPISDHLSLRTARRGAGVSLVEQLRASAALTLDDRIVSAIPGGEPDSGTSQERYKLWRETQNGKRPTEYLLPRIVRRVECTWPPFMHRAAEEVQSDDLRAKLAELGPWYVPFALGDPVVNTMEFTDNFGAAIFADDNAQRMQFRTELIGGTLGLLLGDELGRMSVLDVGCNSGWFSFDLAERGARAVDGVDLRPHNIEQARYLRGYFGLDNTRFEVADAMSFDKERRWDVVLNLGVLYHVTDPLRLLQRTYELCERFAIVDTICHEEPFSGFVLFDTKDANHPHEGRESWEFHPTYRGAIDALRYAGFREVVEIVATEETSSGLYRGGGRRCFLAVK